MISICSALVDYTGGIMAIVSLFLLLEGFGVSFFPQNCWYSFPLILYAYDPKKPGVTLTLWLRLLLNVLLNLPTIQESLCFTLSFLIDVLRALDIMICTVFLKIQRMQTYVKGAHFPMRHCFIYLWNFVKKKIHPGMRRDPFGSFPCRWREGKKCPRMCENNTNSVVKQ